MTPTAYGHAMIVLSALALLSLAGMWRGNRRLLKECRQKDLCMTAWAAEAKRVALLRQDDAEQIHRLKELLKKEQETTRKQNIRILELLPLRDKHDRFKRKAK